MDDSPTTRAGAHDISVIGCAAWFLPLSTRIPLKFGPETLTTVTCLRIRLDVEDRRGRRGSGWGETPLSVQWVWPCSLPYEERHRSLKEFSLRLATAWTGWKQCGHPIEVGHAFIRRRLPALLRAHNRQRPPAAPMPWLAALVCCSAFDLALHDAYGVLLGLPVYETYTSSYMHRDLSHYLAPERSSGVSFSGKYPEDYLVRRIPPRIPAWHLVAGKDPIGPGELTGSEPHDGYPVLLADWIRRDGLRCLKVKLRGDDPMWDYGRLVAVGAIAAEHAVPWLSADFNCTVRDPAYVNAMLDRLMTEHPETYGRILYVEQPFPYDLERNRIDVHSVAARKPLFMDESAHDWRLVRLGRALGWTGVALKTCKTQTGAILSACWARAHGMTLMVQDLSNPMLAQIPHVLLAAHAGTIMGVETNGMQFYPDASLPEAAVHPGVYRRHDGEVDLSTLSGPGFGYAIGSMKRELPPPAFAEGEGRHGGRSP
jgi:L-alanine-DL-glutamate epimerase-like enolase superfamily enzyme